MQLRMATTDESAWPKYDNYMVSMTLSERRRERKDFTAFKDTKIQEQPHQALVKFLQRTENPPNVSEKLCK